MLMSFNCRLDFVDASKDSISAFFRDAASRPCGPPALGWDAAQGRGRPSDGG